MARFFFHIRDGLHFLEDHDGDDLTDLDAAKAEALAIARAVLADRILGGGPVAGQAVEVTDEAGSTVASVALLTALGLSEAD